MPTRDEHLEKAQRNEAAALTNDKLHSEWAVTALFCAALHYVEAYGYEMYAVEGYEPHYASHEERGPRIKQYLSPIYKHYRALERSAHEARYQTTAFSEYDVRDLRQQHLQSLKNYILEGLKPPKRG